MRSSSLSDIAQVIRSKNAGPFLLTLDVVFNKEREYLAVKKSRAFNKEEIARLYGISTERVLGITHYDPAKAIKVTLLREVPAGGLGDTDVYGSQQHAPLLEMKLMLDHHHAACNR